MLTADFLTHASIKCGFDLAGIAPLSSFPELDYFQQWIEGGRAGEMGYLAARDAEGNLKRTAVSRAFPWAKSVIVCAVNYNTAERHTFPVPHSTHGPREHETRNEKRESSEGWISRYAWSNRDYHDTLMARLRRLETRLQEAFGPLETRCYVDTGPLIERIYARYAGVGWVGKNTCIINQRIGSWLFLGVILTSLPFARQQQDEHTPELLTGNRRPATREDWQLAPDRCGTCTRCLDACPTDAFPGPYQLDASRCISYLTIEHRSELPEDLRAGMGRHVFGCDICQDVCPWNRKAPISGSPDFQARSELVNPNLQWLATISDKDFQGTFRGSPIKRAKRTGLRRNAVVAMGNSGNRGYLPLLRELANDPDAMVARHAQWAIDRLARQSRTTDAVGHK
ncbi:MAG: QueG-associated DUF1730 domain-containing protein [Terriglobales bacterium]|jgi:epoxyqueuosine reductase